MPAPFPSRLLPASIPALAVALTFTVRQASGGMMPPTPQELAALPKLPGTLPASTLAPAKHPLLLTREDLERGRRNVAAFPWAARYLERQKAVCSRFAAMKDDELRALVPPAGSLYVMGLGMNLDPVHGSRMQWAGWERPFSVIASDGTLYPNEAWPDDGTGFLDPKTRTRFFFTALANASRVKALEQDVLPALADAYALTGGTAHAHAAAVLLDALAAAYSGSIRGPLDYPMPKELRRYGGRLDRPTQQVARGLANYAQVIDLVAMSGELDAPSHFAPGATIRERLARNLLEDGANYCLLFARQLKGLENGMADFNYGAAAAGLLLQEPAFCAPLVSDSKSIYQMLRNNLVRQAFYFEASPGYEFFTLGIYNRSAELVEALRRAKMTDAPSLYAHRGALRFFTAPYRQREVGGHIPLLGNTRVDSEWVEPSLNTPPAEEGTQSGFRKAELLSTWRVLFRAAGEDATEAGRWLKVIGNGRAPKPFEDRWLVFHYDAAAAGEGASQEEGKPAAPGSTFEGGKGIALLRGGSGSDAHGLQLFFGPSQVKSQNEALTWTFFHDGAEWSFDQGRYNAHFRFGWCASSVAHQSLVVNREDVDQTSGTGHLLSFGDLADVQWAMGSHPGVYHRQGVTRFERFLAQVQAEPGGRLLYWLDVGRVEGGTQREESFHTQMGQVTFKPTPEWKPEGNALFGPENLGDLVRGDYTLKGSREGFYWTPPGNGYGFLGNPKIAPQDGPLRTTWKSPVFFKTKQVTLVADFPEAGKGRELILADGPKAPGHPRVPYLLRSDRGSGRSVFAKVLHFTSDGEPLVTAVRTLLIHPAPGNGLAGAWLIERRDGVRDLWVVNDRAGNPLSVKPPGLPKIETDALVCMVRFDSQGALFRALGESASSLRVENGPQLAAMPSGKGRIEAVEPTPEGLALRVRWGGGAAPASWARGLILLNIIPAIGQPSSWRVREVRGDRVLLEDASNGIGGGRAVSSGDGWIQFPQAVSRFSVLQKANARFAEGKPVFAGNRLVGRITEVSADACGIKLDTPLPEGATGDLEIREFAPGDRVELPLRIEWKPSGPS